MSKRTTYCGLVTEAFLGQEITLKGWVNNRRDLGGLIFVDLRDREGIVQVVFNPAFSEEALKIAETVRSEYVVEVQGTVTKRDPETVNPKIKTGQVEVQVTNIKVINKSETPPFSINEENVNVDENIRLKYRYLDLRRQELAQTFKMRHQITRSIRQYLDDSVFHHVASCESAKALWDKLVSLYESRSATSKDFLVRKLVQLRLDEEKSIAEHLNEFQDVINQWANMKVNFDDELQALLLMSSLSESWETLVVSLSNSNANGTISLEMVRSSLLNEELRRKGSELKSVQTKAMVARD